jgi:hypothetical protein
LSRQAVAILKKRQLRGEYVFGDDSIARGGPSFGFTGWSPARTKLAKRLPDVPDWWLHDIRRSLNTLGQSECGIQPHILDLCLSHVGIVQAGVRRHYNMHSYINEKRDALQRWADYIDTTLRPAPKLRLVS